MRDKARIDKIMAKFQQIWKVVPDQRFGQLVENILCMNNIDIERLFFIEDDEFERCLDELLSEK